MDGRFLVGNDSLRRWAHHRANEEVAPLRGAAGRRVPQHGMLSYDLPMRKHVLLYGLLAGTLVAVLRAIEYRWLVLDYSVEIYAALVAALFAGLGIWLGQRLTRKRERIILREVVVPAPSSFVRDQSKVESLGITPRELEILELIAGGLSNREIAERVF